MRYLVKHCLIILICFLSFSDIGSQSILSININLNDIAYNPNDDRIYGAVSGDTENGNSIAIINPVNGDIEKYIRVGSEPHSIRFSTGFEYLYIACHGTNRLDRINLATGMLESMVSLLESSTGLQPKIYHKRYVSVIQPVYSKPERVILGSDDSPLELAVIDGNKELPNQLSIQNTSQSLAYHIASGYYYGYGHTHRNKGLLKYSVDDKGITFIEQYSLLSGDIADITIVGDRLFSRNGDVLDLSSGNPVHIGNIYTVQNRQFLHGVVTASLTGDAIFNVDFEVSPPVGERGYYLYKIDPVDLTINSSIRIPGIEREWPHKLIYTGTADRLALIFHTGPSQSVPVFLYPGKLMLIGACQNAPQTQSIQIAQTTTDHCKGDTVTFSASGSYDRYYWSNGLQGQQITFELHENETLFVEAFDNDGCMLAKSTPLELISHERGTIEYVGSPDRIKCKNATAELSAGSDNASLIKWSTGQVSPSIHVMQPGVYSAYAFNGPDCTDGSIREVVIKEFPGEELSKAEIINTGINTICEGDVVYLEAPLGFHSYEWDGVDDFNGRLLGVHEEGSYRVRYLDAYGCVSDYSDAIDIVLFEAPEKPKIRRNDSLLYTSDSGRKEWFYNGNLVVGNNSDALFALNKGYYSLRTTSAQGCKSPYSDPIEVDKYYIDNIDTLNGIVFIDYNRNGLFDGPHEGFPDQRVFIEPFYITYTNSNGAFSYLLPSNTYYVRAVLDTAYWAFAQGENGHSADLSGPNDSIYYFGVYPHNPIPNMSVNITAGIFRCNRFVPVWVHFRNTGGLLYSDSICVDIDPRISKGKVNQVLLDPLPNKICWHVDSLSPGQKDQLFLMLEMPDATFIGDKINLSVYVEVDGKSISVDDFSETLRCSYDPNDKNVSPQRGPEGQYALFEDTLEYLIRFQNSGNDTAFRVQLVDQLSEYLDWRSFHPVSASHEYSLDLDLSTGLLNVVFDPIILPDSFTNPIASQGYFLFSIMAKDSIAENTSITNNVDIYFDSNEPINTNTTESVLVSKIPVITSIGTGEAAKRRIKIVPNPHENSFNVHSLYNEDIEIVFYDSFGQIVYKTMLSQQSHQRLINTDGWPSGVYYYVVRGQTNDCDHSGMVVKR